MEETKSVVPLQKIEKAIFMIRGQKVMLDKDLAALYKVSTSVFNKAVTRNIERFPSDFMFQLTKEEFSNLKYHFGTSSWGGTRKLPRAFTEQGVAMLSSVLRSKRAVQVNIEIMRVFVRLREMLATHKELAHKFEKLERRITEHDEQIQTIFDVIKQLMAPPEKKKNKISFEVNEGGVKYGIFNFS
ncbi:MAG: ORF6N domain-containing protein [Deltaproteobacteria bacterium]|nr:ORF6N domain-containing protein [Deltaproteobacteria bacterium]